MSLSVFQKSIVTDILSGKTFDLLSYAKAVPMKMWGGESSKDAYEPYPGLRVALGDPVNQMMDENDAFVQLKEFVAMWDYLEGLRLIKSIQVRRPPTNRLIIFGADKTSHYTMMSLIGPYIGKEIVVLPGLSDFVKRRFVTEQEAGNRLTRRVAYISLGISALLAIATTLFNYYTTTSERVVTLKNPKDTMKVIFVNPTDSSRLHKGDSTSLGSDK